MNELQRNSSPQFGYSMNTGQQLQQQQQSRPVPVRLTPDALVDASDLARNLASSPTCQLVLERDGPGRNMDAVSQRVYSPVPSYVMDENASGTFSDFSGRSTPQQSHTFKVS